MTFEPSRKAIVLPLFRRLPHAFRSFETSRAESSDLNMCSVFIGLFESDLTVEHYDRGKIGIPSVRPFECAGMLGLCAGSGFEGAVMRDGSHIEMIE